MIKSKNQQRQTAIAALDLTAELGAAAVMLTVRYWPGGLAAIPWLAGVAMLPFTVLSGVAAWLNHKMVPGAKAPWEVWWSYRYGPRISHPYMTLGLVAVYNVLGFALGNREGSTLQIVAIVLILLYELGEIAGGIYLERKYKRMEKEKRRETKRRRRKGHVK